MKGCIQRRGLGQVGRMRIGVMVSPGGRTTASIYRVLAFRLCKLGQLPKMLNPSGALRARAAAGAHLR